MVGDNGYYAPAAYDQLWLWLACGILGLIVLWYIAVWFYPRAVAPKRRPVAAPDAGELSRRYHRLIDDIESAHAAGELTTRQAHLGLSVLVRRYSEEQSGTTYTTMTLAELTDVNRAHLTGAVATFYPFEFAPTSSDELAPSLQRAREVVS